VAAAARPALLAAQEPVAAPAAAATNRSAWKDDGVLRVCADPHNLPFSNERKEGFDNRIAALIAAELGDSLAYLWWPQRRGFIRNTLRARECDVVFGLPQGFDPVMPTRAYYRSTYHLVYPAERKLNLKSLDDAALRELRIGAHFIGEDYTHTPPVHALLARGIFANVKGFSTFYGEENDPRDIFTALERGEIDVAVVWGPLAGYFARRSAVPLTIVPLPDDQLSGLPFQFDVTMGVRRSDKDLKARLDEILERRGPDIQRILDEYNVPTLRRSAAAPDSTGDRRPPGGA
jgi:quinoprotein dehydrogenase-associated probable ABC transporter substrate-binding protein